MMKQSRFPSLQYVITCIKLYCSNCPTLMALLHVCIYISVVLPFFLVKTLVKIH